MPVKVWMRDDFQPLVLEGDLLTLVNQFNIAATNGLKFYVTQDTEGRGVMVQMANINKAYDVEEGDDAFIGG